MRERENNERCASCPTRGNQDAAMQPRARVRACQQATNRLGNGKSTTRIDQSIDRFKRTNERTNEPPDESWERMRSFEHERRCHRLRCESWSASDSEGRRDSRSVACSRDTARAASLEPRRPPRRSHGSLRTASAAARESREHCWDPRKSVARSWRASRAMTTTTKKHRTRRHWWRPTTPR